MCLYPQLILNKRYTETKKNGGIIPPIIDPRTRVVAIGCEQCIECRKQKARAWQIRLLEDIKKHKGGKFITLTFSEEWLTKLEKTVNDKWRGTLAELGGYNLQNEIATVAVKRFRERYRDKWGTSIRHWLITELGHEGTERIHLHGIIWTDKNLEHVEQIWKYGYMWKGTPIHGAKGKIEYKNYVNNRTVNYIMKYVHKVDEKHKEFRGKILTSPGIGANYMERTDWIKNQYNGTNTIETYRSGTGHKMGMPIYYRNKIYTDQEREMLWIQKLNKEERWICGERVEYKNGIEPYYDLLSYHRERSKRLGYGTGTRDWSRNEYEKQRKMLRKTSMEPTTE